MLDRLSPGTAAYNIAWSVRLTGPLQSPALAAALTWITERHEALRTTFTATDGEPAQVVRPAAPVKPTLTDLTRLPEAERDRQARELTDAEARTPFDLGTGPLLRARLVRTAAQEHLLILVVHHIVADGWSFATFFRELGHAYGELAAGRAPALPPPAIQYADFAVWQREQAAAGRFADDLEFWRAELTGAPTLLDLPTDRPRPPEQSPEGGLVEFGLSAEVAAGVRDAARAAGTSVFAVLLAAYQALLHRISGQDDLLVAVPVAGRTLPETGEVIGFFANTLALRARVEPATTFAELLAAARDSTVAATARQEVPFEQLVDALNPPRSLAHPPLVQVMFALEEPPAPVTAGDVRIAPRLHENGTVKFDLTLTVEERPGELRGRITYRRELFDADRVDGLAQAYQVLLAAAVARPATPVAQLPLLADAAVHELVRRWRAEDETRPAHRDPVALLAAHPPADPDTVAVGAGDGTELTYRELAARSNRLARRLRAAGAAADAVVAICLPPGPDLVAAILGVWKAGAGYLPVDPALPAERIAVMFDDARPAVLVTDGAGAARLPATPAPVVRLDAPAALVGCSDEELPGHAHPASVAYLLYTSGSTGLPKGVVVTRESVANLLTAVHRRLAITAADRVAALTTAAFDISVVELIAPLLAGARVEPVDAALRQDAAALRAELAARRVSVVQATPTGWRMLLARRRGAAGRTAARQRRRGARPRPGRRPPRRRGDPAQRVRPHRDHRLLQPRPRRRDRPGRPRRAGRPHPAAPARPGRPAGPAGVPGELHIGGIGVARGYHNRPGATADRFRPDPFSARPGARLYATGDLARRLPSGRLEHLGRVDQQIKLRGYRIEPGEIEAALRTHPSIADAVVTCWREGDDDARLAAHVVLAGPGEPTPAEATALWPAIRAELARRLPEYMLPATLVAVPRLPRTASGKVDRGALPRPTWREAVPDAHVAPRDPAERTLAALWQEVLGVTRVGVHDDFFALGGHSLTATRLTTRIRAEFGVELPLRSLFAAPTVAGLAALLAASHAGRRHRRPRRPDRPARTRPAGCPGHPVGPADRRTARHPDRRGGRMTHRDPTSDQRPRAVVIGAGLAGSLAACYLARRGYRGRRLRATPRPPSGPGRRTGPLDQPGALRPGDARAARRRAPRRGPQAGRADARPGGAPPRRQRPVPAVRRRRAPHPALGAPRRADRDPGRRRRQPRRGPVPLRAAARRAGPGGARGDRTPGRGRGGGTRTGGPCRRGRRGLLGHPAATAARAARQPLADRPGLGLQGADHPSRGPTAAPGCGLEALHVWPAEQGLMVAHPNRDASLTCSLFLALRRSHRLRRPGHPGADPRLHRPLHARRRPTCCPGWWRSSPRTPPGNWSPSAPPPGATGGGWC